MIEHQGLPRSFAASSTTAQDISPTAVASRALAHCQPVGAIDMAKAAEHLKFLLQAKNYEERLAMLMDKGAVGLAFIDVLKMNLECKL